MDNVTSLLPSAACTCRLLKWLDVVGVTARGLSRHLSKTGLFGKNALQLPLQSISMGSMQEIELRESTEQSVWNAKVKVPTGQRWNTQSEVDQAVSRPQH